MMLRPKENMLNDIRQNFRKEVREQIPKLWLAFVEPHSCEDGSDDDALALALEGPL